MRNPNPDMLLHIGIGDAYCVALEYTDWHDNHAELLRIERYLPHPSYHRTLKPGRYTDDTQMSIAVAEALVEARNVNNPILLQQQEFWVKHFLSAFKRDPRDGYSRGFQKFLERTTSVNEFLRNIRSDSDKNGAAMRSVPLGVLFDPESCMTAAAAQASVTHNTYWGRLSSQVVALASHYVLYEMYDEGDLCRLTEYILDWLGTEHGVSDLVRPWEARVQGPAVGKKTAHAALSILRTTKTMREVILRTLLYKGDTDSVAAIALGIAGASHWHDLPDFLEHCLEPGGQFGPTYLRDLGSRLMEAYSVYPGTQEG